MEVIRPSETTVYLRTKRRYIPEGNCNFYNYRCENFKPTRYIDYAEKEGFMQKTRNASRPQCSGQDKRYMGESGVDKSIILK
jgi:hypothetical protein